MYESVESIPSASVPSSIMQELYRRRALTIALSSLVLFGSGNERISVNNEIVYEKQYVSYRLPTIAFCSRVPTIANES
jgi:hypothetical protein